MAPQAIASRKIAKDLSKLYYNLNSDVAYGNVNQLYAKVKDRYSKEQVNEWLLKQLSHTLHRSRRRRNYARRQMYTGRPYNNLQADLADMSYFHQKNLGYKYFLLVIDVFSRKVFVRSLRSKKGQEVAQAMEDILESMPTIAKLLCTDRGGEFLSPEFQRLLKKYKMKHFHTQNYDLKAAIAERAIGTVKRKLYKYLTGNLTEKWIDALPKIVKNYNNTYHTSIKEKPNNVSAANVEEIAHNSWKKSKAKKLLRVGDYVRLANVETIFTRGFLPLWTDEIYMIERVITKRPPTYAIKEIDGENLEGTFYNEELQRISKPDERAVYRVERILARRGNKILVKWQGYTDAHNQWINKKDYKEGRRL